MVEDPQGNLAFAEGEGHAVPRAAVGGELALELLQLRPEQVPARLDGSRDRALQLTAQLLVRGAEIRKGTGSAIGPTIMPWRSRFRRSAMC